MTCPWPWVGWPVLLLACLSACQPLDPKTETASAEPVATVEPAVTPPPDIRWSEMDGCLGMLALLKRGLDEGLIADLDDTPFMLIGRGSVTGLSSLSASGRRTVSGSEALVRNPDVRCVLRVGHAIDHRSDHRVLGREQVRSRYQSGTRSEKNPAYEVAKARLRRAEKAAKPGKSSIIKVGDPLLDLVGTLVGGALTGFGQWGAGDQVEEALDTLMATPPSIERPKYAGYHFERSRVRASREATIPVILTDRVIGRSFETSLKRRELKDLFVVTGLDRQDENFARHSQDGLSEDGLQQWLAEAPSLPLADIAAGLLDRSATIPFDRLALAASASKAAGGEPFPDDGPVAEGAVLPDDVFLDAAALPLTGPTGIGGSVLGPPSSDARNQASLIKVIGETSRAQGVFIAPHFILAPSEVVGERGLVDVEDKPGHLALGLVAAIDRGLGLALVQAPLAGRPVTIGGTPSEGLGQQATSSISGDAVGTPLLVDGQLIGFRMAAGPDIGSDAIRIFQDRQRHILPFDR